MGRKRILLLAESKAAAFSETELLSDVHVLPSVENCQLPWLLLLALLPLIATPARLPPAKVKLSIAQDSLAMASSNPLLNLSVKVVSVSGWGGVKMILSF